MCLTKITEIVIIHIILIAINRRTREVKMIACTQRAAGGVNAVARLF